MVNKVFEAPPGFKPSYNIAPSQTIWGLKTEEGQIQTTSFYWGFLPAWAKASSTLKPVINARAETVDTKPFFKAAFRKHRCIIFANGYYEWQATSQGKQPYYIHLPSESVLGIAALWATREHESPEQLTYGAALIVTEASPSLQSIHSRMPVILKSEQWVEWLRNDDISSLKASTIKTQDIAFEAYPVSKRVNTARNNDERIILKNSSF